MKKLRFFGLLAAVVLLAFAFLVACDNGSTTPPPPPGGEDGAPDQYPILGGNGSAGAATSLINWSVTTRVLNDGAEDPEEYDPTTEAIIVVFQTRAQADDITGANLDIDPKVTGADGSWAQGAGSDINKWIYTLTPGSVTTSGPVEVWVKNKPTYVGIRKTVNVLAAELDEGLLNYTVVASPASGVSTKLVLTFADADKDKLATVTGFVSTDIIFDPKVTGAVAEGKINSEPGGTWAATAGKNNLEWTLNLPVPPIESGNVTVKIDGRTSTTADDPESPNPAAVDGFINWGITDQVKQVALTARDPVPYTVRLGGTAPAINKVTVVFAAANLARLEELGFVVGDLSGSTWGDTGVTGTWAKSDTAGEYDFTFTQTTGAPKAGTITIKQSRTGVDKAEKEIELTAPAPINYSVTPVATGGAGDDKDVTASLLLEFPATTDAAKLRLTELGLVAAFADSAKVVFDDKGTSTEATGGWVTTTLGTNGEVTRTFTTKPAGSTDKATVTISVPGISPTPRGVTLVGPKVAWTVTTVTGSEASLAALSATNKITLKFAANPGSIFASEFAITGVKAGAASGAKAANVSNAVSTSDPTVWELILTDTTPGTVKISTTNTNLKSIPEAVGGDSAKGTQDAPFRLTTGTAITYQVEANGSASEATDTFTFTFSASLAGLTISHSDVTIEGDEDSGPVNTPATDDDPATYLTPVVASPAGWTEIAPNNGTKFTVTAAVTISGGTATASIAFPPVRAADVEDIVVFGP